MEFYAPWCGHCKSLAPEYAAAAQRLAADGSSIKLAKVDATVHSQSAGQFDVRGYPTLKFFKNAIPQDYSGGRTADEIVNWVTKKSGPSTVALSSADEAQKAIDENEVAVIAFLQDPEGEEGKAYTEVADMIDSVPFFVVTEGTVFDHFSVEGDNAVVLFKQFDEGRVNFEGTWNGADLKAFVDANQLPLVVEFNDQVAPKVFGGDIKTHVLLFLAKSDEGFEALVQEHRDAAADYKGEMIFLYVDAEDENHERILDYFGIATDALPQVRLIDMNNNDMKKYRPEVDDVTAANLREFCDGFKAGTLKPHLMSEEIPEEQNDAVYTLVGKAFEDVAFDPEKNVFVEFYAPWCGHCKQLAPTWKQLAEKYAGMDNVIIAQMDSTANEVERVQIQGFPTLKFFPAGEGEKIEDYDGGRNLEDFVDFLESKGLVAAEGGDDEAKDEL